MEMLASSEVTPVVFRKAGSRKVFRKDGFADAAQMIGDLHDGDDLCGITNGQFSLVDMLQHVLTQTGPADVVIATWTMGVYDAEKAYEFVTNDSIRNIRFIVDPSMFIRRPELASVLVKGFGAGSFRAVNSHAKFCTVRSDKLAVTMRTSMNLNENKRLESFDLSCDGEMTSFFEGLADEVWRTIEAKNRSQSRAIFEDLLGASQLLRPWED